MDAVISTALETICSEGQNGLSIQTLFNELQQTLTSQTLDLSPAVKQSLWANLLKIPTLQFYTHYKNNENKCCYSGNDERIQKVEDAEKMSLRVCANEQLSDCFIGLYDVRGTAVNINPLERNVLERLAAARTNGITQNQLSKEVEKKPNNFFNVVMNLESRGLIVRQSAQVKTRIAGSDGTLKGCSNITTRMVYLSRYAKPKGFQERIEIVKDEAALDSTGDMLDSDLHEDDSTQDCCKEDINVKDYLPEMKAVCDKLEQADNKVLVVSHIKRELGYGGSSSGHRAWRTVLKRLTDANHVEQFDAKLNGENGKVVKCLRLLKSISSKKHEPNTLISEDNVAYKEGKVKFGRKCPITDQLVELPIEHQVFDLVDAAGTAGMTLKEISNRLGVNSKKNYIRFRHMFQRFGMHMEVETVARGANYRVWTPGNFNHGWRKACDNADIGGADVPLLSYQRSLDFGPIMEGEHTSSKNVSDRGNETEPSEEPRGNGECNNMLISLEKQKELLHGPSSMTLDAKYGTLSETSVVLSEKTPPSSLMLKESRSNQRHPSINTADFTRRKQQIMERLKDEKFVLQPELYRWLVNLEKDRGTTIDRKTLYRILNKLQKEGYCKCVDIALPLVTNCSRSRTTQVILHPPSQILTDELLGEIHDSLRSFEMQSRGQAASKGKNNESVPILSGVQRTPEHIGTDAAAIKAETMRANGFVLAKMVRTKLLHIFLWEYMNSSYAGDFLSSQKHVNDLKNPHSTCCLFSLEEAIKHLPLELFLQVVGSVQKFDDMIEKCKRGLCLADLPREDYRSLMDTQASGRLSLVIDILRRLKLIRLVSDGSLQDEGKVPQATFTHALELKPYIEEPSSLAVTTSNLNSTDLRPRIRHDFTLSNKDAVYEYWKVLEYCYATADPKAAVCSFPGSAVSEVFRFRSWASVRVMSVDQRAQLLKRIEKDDADKKLSYRECEKIAKDLNLSLEQVLRVYYDKRQQRLNRLSGNRDRNQPSEVQRALASRKRKRVSRRKKASNKIGHSDENEEVLHKKLEDNNLVDEEEPEPNEEDHTYHSFTHQRALPKMRPTRLRRFTWTEETDRQLVIIYARHRAALGAKVHRVDWDSLSDLPAPPKSCQKRMASLKRNSDFRTALMRLCNMLSERYVNHLQKTQEGLSGAPVNDVERANSKRGSSTGEILLRNLADNIEGRQETYLKEQWDDFTDENINNALEKVLHWKRMFKLKDQQHSQLVPATTCNDILDQDGEEYKDFAWRSRCNRFRQKFIKLLNDDSDVSRQIYESLAISNAVELFKLVFMSTSTTPEVADLLAETLRRYSEHDLYAAFSYLREKKIMIGGNIGQPFELSQHFLHNISRSPFPGNTGKRASKFSSWLHEREKDLMEGEVHLNPDLQCGDILHLFALLSTGELSITPCLPDEGVGEAEDLRGSKRKNDSSEFGDGGKAKKVRSLPESELTSRREKGFPGIMVSICRSTISAVEALQIFKYKETFTNEYSLNNGFNATAGQKTCCSSPSDHTEEILYPNSTVTMGGNGSDAPWEAMSSYARQLISVPQDKEQTSFLCPELFQTVYSAIVKAGDQGLSFKEISEVMDMPGEDMVESVVDVLQSFGRALKVNAYDSVKVVDALYHSKYFLTPKVVCQQDHKQPFVSESQANVADNLTGDVETPDRNVNRSEMRMASQVGDVHKVTILNLPEPEEMTMPLHNDKTSNVNEGCSQEKHVSRRGLGKAEYNFCSPGQCMPILPWINGDGTINKVIFKGLVRRVLGIVMQNPGMVEDDIITQMDVLNPQSCRKLLELMILENHLVVRKMHQTTSVGPPSILGTLLSKGLTRSKISYRDHFFANPMSTSML